LLIVAVAVAMVLIAALDDSSWLGKLLSVRPLRWFGTISYGLYLWHLPFLHLAAYALKPQGFSSVTVAAIAVPAVIGVATLSFYMLERPISRAGRAWLRRRDRYSDDRGGNACDRPIDGSR
jgi:peptidoglycan/LPS O-acetylase OafA/YrhL